MKLFGILLLTVAAAYADDVALYDLQQGNLEFTSALYQELIKNTPGNVILSPLSVQLVLGLTRLGAKGDTALEMSKGLYLPNSPEKIKKAFQALIPKLKGNEHYSLNSANKIYIMDGYTINPDFFKLAQEIFEAGVENINFNDTVKASQIINNWVEIKTNNKIKNLISPKMLNNLTRLLLVNAVYFKAKWSSPFNAYQTSKRTFFTYGKKEIEVDTMHQVHNFRYGENKKLDVKFLEIPYDGDDVSFTIALPNKRDGLAALEKRLSEVLVPQNLSYEKVSLYMPKFITESTFGLIPALKQLGIKKAFDDKEADFSLLLSSPYKLVISGVIQKAFVNVSESGTEAAAATAAIVGIALAAPSPIRQPIQFEVNRPFLYIIRQKSSQQVLFVGRISIL